MKYFYAGIANSRHESSIQFCGVWGQQPEENTPYDVVCAIVNYKRNETGMENVVLTSFNTISIDKRIEMNFDDLALGARFCYLDSTRVWIKLNGDGCGLIAEYDNEMIAHEKWMGQCVCSAKDDDDDNLMVCFVE